MLGASAGFIGAIEGAAESTAALLKLASGWWSDRMQTAKAVRRRGIHAGVGRAAARRDGAVARRRCCSFASRDRVGKGIRNSPRDALIADSVDPAMRGRAFGLRSAADNAGALLGPLIAFALLAWGDLSLRTVFWLVGDSRRDRRRDRRLRRARSSRSASARR